ncbi:MAG: A/G-specific adenine glycosylase [Polyangiaceae bacterium]|nr:A/G-specific adenine glycosylase [Polyangiaceae bacterium]
MPKAEDVAFDTTLQPASQLGCLNELHSSLLSWFTVASARRHREMPWRSTRDAYAIWISEVMLQQTRVQTVTSYYERFLARFPTVLALADAHESDVLALWSGLGYYRRARLLHAGARVVADLGGTLPPHRHELLGVPGIGQYTASAIASIAFGEAVGLVDGNVARVLARMFEIEDDMRTRGMRVASKIADRIVARLDPGTWNQALMDLGSTVCTPRKPACTKCPVLNHCRARASARTSELPFLSAKSKPISVRLQSLVVERSDSAILLVRRAPDGLFGGLWEPPSRPSRVGARAEAARIRLASDFGVGLPLRVGVVEHVLSHRKLRVDVLYVRVGKGTRAPRAGALPEGYDGARFVIPSDFEKFGIASLARKIMACAGIVLPRT